MTDFLYCITTIIISVIFFTDIPNSISKRIKRNVSSELKDELKKLSNKIQDLEKDLAMVHEIILFDKEKNRIKKDSILLDDNNTQNKKHQDSMNNILNEKTL